MGEYLDQIPERLRNHIAKIAATSGLEKGGETVELIARAWLEKKAAFEERIAESAMEELDEFLPDEEKGAIALTYSGSLLTIGPLVGGVRKVDYASIGLRRDVPESASAENTKLKAVLRVDDPAVFSAGPVERSSAVFKIAVAKEELAQDEEDALLSEVTQVLTEDFVELNKTIVVS